MSKKISGELHFDADPATVYAMVSDQAYVQEKNERTGGQNVKADVTDNGADGCKIVVSRDLPAEIPAFAKKFVGEQISTVQTDEWGPANDDGSYSAKFHVDFGKAPMVIDGTMAIDTEGAGSVLRVNADVKASVPFVGESSKVLPRSNSTGRYARNKKSGRNGSPASSPNRRQLTATVWGSSSVLSRRRRGGLAQRGRGREVLARSCAGSSPTR